MNDDRLFESLRRPLGSTEPDPDFRVRLLAELRLAASASEAGPVDIDAATSITVRGASDASRNRRLEQRRGGVRTAVALSVAAAIAVVAVTISSMGEPGAKIETEAGVTGAPVVTTSTVSTSAIAIPVTAIEAAGGQVIPLTRAPTQVVVAGDDLWVQFDGGPLERRSAVDGTVRATVDLAPGGVTESAPPLLAFGSLWVPMVDDGEVARIDPDTGVVTARLAIPGGLASEADATTVSRLAASADGVWVLSGTGPVQELVEIDPAANEVASTLPAGEFPYSIEFGFGSLWVTHLAAEPGVRRIDPATGAVLADVELPIRYADVVVDDASLWIYGDESAIASVVRIDPATNQVVARIPTSEASVPLHGPSSLVFTDGLLWVTAPDVKAVAIDTDSNAVVARYGPGGGMVALSAGADRLWIADPFGRTLSMLPLP